MNTERKWTSPQAFVDRVVGNCLATGIRTRAAIIRKIQTGRIMERNVTPPTMLTGLEDLDITPKSLAHKISLSTSRTDAHGHRDTWCVPKVHRFVSLARFDELTGTDHALPADEYVEFVQSREDIFAVADKKEAEALKLLADVKMLRDRATNAHSAVLDLA